jgi:putative CocE/NonD family hydrolase
VGALVAAVAALIALAAPASAAPVTKHDVTIPASDGVHLSGDVHLPSAHGRYPAIVDMEPYGRSTATTYLKAGYAHVNTDVRGSGKSGGSLCLLCYREQLDVRDVVEWAARQPWSNGKVVLYGYSYSAITALLGASLEPKHLTAVIVGHPPTDPYRDVIWQNGLYLQGFVAQWFAGQTAAQSIGGPPGAQALDRAQQEFVVETREIPLDGAVYHERSVIDRMKRIKVPTYVFTGWADMYSRGDLWLIDGLGARHKLLWIDASTHHGKGRGGQLDAPYDSADEELTALSAAAPKGEVRAWLDRFVKGRRNGIARKPRVRYFDLGDRTWHHARSWRAVTRRRPSLYLSAAKSGTAHSVNDGTLSRTPPKGRDAYQEMYVYDPSAGSSIPIDREGPDGFLPYAPLDQRFDEPHGLTYTTPPLRRALHLAGPSELRFWAITEASDMAWVGRLVDVAPDGSARLITTGWLRSSFRRVDPKRSRDGAPYLPDDRQLPVEIGSEIKYRMDIWDTAYTLKPGHRLRLWLSSSDSPNHEPLPVAGRNLVLHDGVYPSRLILGTRP